MRCPECHKKFVMNPENRPVCDFYKAGQCKYGPKGQNKEGKCFNRHPDPCQKSKCTDKKCKLMHPAPVCSFYKKQACERKFCKFSHPKGSSKEVKAASKPDIPEKKKKGKKSPEAKNPSDAHIAAIDLKMDTFLGEMAKFTKELNQMKSQIEANGSTNNNRLGFQSAAFPTMLMQQNPQLQAMQQRF